MIWTISGYICLFVTFGAIIGVGWSYLRFAGKSAAAHVRLATSGRIVKAWVVMANTQIYEKGRPEDEAPAVVVCTLENLEDLDDFLEDVTRDLKRFKQKDPDSPEEEMIERVMRTKIPHYTPVRIPKRITRGPEAYFAGVHISRPLLPKRKLTLPYVYVRIWVGEDYDTGATKMVPYPDRRR
ncbi:MAG: hypothetical protein ACFCD0_10210 [Gemmataceae bacterium]